MPSRAAHRDDAAGFSLIELLIASAISMVIVGAILTAMTDVYRLNDLAQQTNALNGNLRTAMDLMIRDFLQVGQGLPAGRVVLIPSGGGSGPINRPGPPGTAYTFPVGAIELPAVTEGPGLGPMINGVTTDMITTLAVDSAFETVGLTALAADGSTMTVDPAVNITDGGPDDLRVGDIIMFTKGALSALQVVTAVNGQTVTFNTGPEDPLNLNQRGAANGTIMQLLADAPPDVPSPVFLPTRASRIRMVSYYLDALTDPTTPRLVRRLNSGQGMTVAFAVENLQISYDLADGVTNPTNVRMTAADLDGSGRCAPSPCSQNQIRKLNVVLTGRSARRAPTGQFLHNTLASQVSLRSLAFVDRYR
jgi:type II secretory pathway pseudopilin PulG